MSRTISQAEDLITDIASIFNNYFSSVADTAKEDIIKYSHKHFSDDLNNPVTFYIHSAYWQWGNS